MAKIRAEMDGPSIKGASGRLCRLPAIPACTDPQFYARTPEELLMRSAWVAKKFDAKAAQYFGYLPRRALPSSPCRTSRRPTTRRAAAAGRLPGQHLQLAVAPLYSMPALTLHESAPGHAFQMPVALEQKAARPSAAPTSLRMAKAGRCTASASAPRWASTKRL
jgi:uncharacterized protein (DUF885 family)